MVSLFFILTLSVVIVQRLLELGIARRNARLLLSQGAVEVGAEHYKWIVTVHASFFISLIIEVARIRDYSLPTAWWLPFSLFVLAQIFRVWCIASLGRFWNTRIYVLPGATVVKRGPYRWMRHPNYAVVIAELFLLPLIFGAYGTSLLFTAVNLWVLLAIRIPAEERALIELTNYGQEMMHTSR
jgi:methyltransferase